MLVSFNYRKEDMIKEKEVHKAETVKDNNSELKVDENQNKIMYFDSAVCLHLVLVFCLQLGLVVFLQQCLAISS